MRSRDMCPVIFSRRYGVSLSLSARTPSRAKISVNEESEFDSREDDVGLACEPRSIDAEAVSASMELPANCKLDFGVLAANAGHGHAPLLDRHVVGHGDSP